MKKINSKGKCLCGGIKFTTKGFHREVSNCHCIQCMKTHGNFAAYTRVDDNYLKFQSKKTLKWFKSSKRLKEVSALNVVQVYFLKQINLSQLQYPLVCLINLLA